MADSATKEATAIAAKVSEDASKDLKTIEKVSATEEEDPTTVKMVEPMVVIDMAEKKEDQPRTHGISPIPQLDGICEIESLKNESREIFSFKSDCAEEDIKNCLEEIFKNTNVTSKKIILRDQLGPKRGDLPLHLRTEN